MTALDERVHPHYREVGRLVERVLPRIDYKQHAELEVDWHPHPILHVRFREVTDTYNRHRSIDVDHPYPVPPYLREPEDVIRWVRECIHRTEQHEADEWLTVDGRRLFDPHG